MNYQIVDLSAWERGGLFHYYMDQLPIVNSMTVDIEVTPLVTYAKRSGLHFYPCMLWVVSKVINDHEEFKYGWSELGELIRYSFVSPSHVEFHAEDECFTKMVTPYSDDILDFHARVLADRARYENARGILADQPRNAFDVSCLPWVHYKSFDMQVFDAGKHLSPVVTWGKYEAREGGLLLPLSMRIHHAVADGFHLSRFFVEVQRLIDQLERKDRNDSKLILREEPEKELDKSDEKALVKND